MEWKGYSDKDVLKLLREIEPELTVGNCLALKSLAQTQGARQQQNQ